MWNSKEYNHKDFHSMIDLIIENYGDVDISKEDFLKWQYEKNPAGDAVIRLAKDKEKSILAGQYVVIPMNLKIHDKIVKGTLSLNTLTKAEYRGQGIFTKLAEDVYRDCCDKNLAFSYGFPNPNSYPGFIRKLSFKEIGRVPLMIRPLNFSNLISKRLLNLTINIFPNIPYFRKTRTFQEKDIFLYEINQCNVSDVDQLWNDIEYNYSIIGIRNAEFIKWRYLDIPLRKYKILAVRNSEKMLGYIIGNCNEVEGVKSGMIVDFIFNSKYKIVGDILINSIVEYFKTQNMDLIGSLMLSHTNEYEALRKNKFYKCPKRLEPQPFPIIYRAHSEKGKNHIIYDINNWFLTMGDYDVI